MCNHAAHVLSTERPRTAHARVSSRAGGQSASNWLLGGMRYATMSTATVVSWAARALAADAKPAPAPAPAPAHGAMACARASALGLEAAAGAAPSPAGAHVHAAPQPAPQFAPLPDAFKVAPVRSAPAPAPAPAPATPRTLGSVRGHFSAALPNLKGARASSSSSANTGYWPFPLKNTATSPSSRHGGARSPLLGIFDLWGSSVLSRVSSIHAQPEHSAHDARSVITQVNGLCPAQLHAVAIRLQEVLAALAGRDVDVRPRHG